MRILVLGAGATGGYYGARLLEVGRDVTFLVRSGRAKQLKSDGLTVKSKFGDFSAKDVKLIEKASDKYDLIILACKAWDLESAINSVAPAVGDSTAILPLLNGIKHLQILKDRFGENSVLGGLCIISSTLDADGTILHLNDTHAIKYGELSGQKTDRILRVNTEFENAKCAPKLSDDISTDMWEKWVMISSLAALTTLMRATVGEVARAPFGPEIARNIFDECIGIAAAHGNKLSEAFICSARDRLVDPASKLAASMLRDLQNGNNIESDHIIGSLIEKAKERGVGSPNLEIAYCNLKTYELAKPQLTASTKS